MRRVSRERWAIRDIIIVSLVWISIGYSRRKAGTLRDDAIHASVSLSVCLFFCLFVCHLCPSSVVAGITHGSHKCATFVYALKYRLMKSLARLSDNSEREGRQALSSLHQSETN